MASTPGKSVEPARYKLYGVLYHHSGSAGSGGAIRLMFVTLTETAVVEKLGYTSTTKVSAVRHNEVFGGHNVEWVDDRCVYMLFYCRTASIRTL